MIFQYGTKLTELQETHFATEKEMQHFVESHMNALLGLEFIATEFVVGQYRFDSVAYDQITNGFIIIEYKKDKSFSVVDQGYAYLATVMDHKADFVLKYNHTCKVSRGIGDFDWTQIRIYFIAEQFTKYQIGSINFKDLPMELWRIRRFTQGIVSFDRVQSNATSVSITGYIPGEIGKSALVNKNGEKSQEVIVYTEDDHVKRGNTNVQELYNELRDYIFSTNEEISIKPTKLYIGFLLGNKHLLDIKIQLRSLVLWLNRPFGTLDDPRNMVEDVTHKGHHGNGACQIKLTGRVHIGYVKDLIATHINNAI